MSAPALITFIDDYAPDHNSVELAAKALAQGDPAGIRWPARTAEVLERKQAGRETIVDELMKRGGDASGVKQYDTFLGEAEHYAAAGSGLAGTWHAVISASGGNREAALALGTFARFANLKILAALARIELEGEGLGLEDELRKVKLHKLYNSSAGHAAFGVSERLFAIDVEVARGEAGHYVFAPEPLIRGLYVGDKVRGELLTVWTIPQSEALLLASDAERDYHELTIWHVRDHEFEELGLGRGGELGEGEDEDD
jgi:hypothetical protein